MGERPWDELRYAELMQTFRLLSTQVTQYNLGLTIALVTLMGFSIDRESWGLAALGLVLEAVMLFTLEIHRRGSVVLLDEAAELERVATGGGASTTDAMHAVMSGRTGIARAAGQWAVMAAMCGHVAFTVFLAVGLDWSFAGR